MRIGLFDVDGKLPNLALMKISAKHKQQDDQVEMYSPLFHHFYDKIYASKIFTRSHPNDKYLRKNMLVGGSGINLKMTLSAEVEHIYPDYSLYEIDYAIGFITRGCIRKCKFCIVPEKEGKIYKNADLTEFCKDQRKVMLWDNNILAYPDHLTELKKLRDSGKRIDFNQGLDIRLITKENAKIIKEIPRWQGQRYRFALDHPALIPIVDKKLEILCAAGFTMSSLNWYVLIGFDTTPKEDMQRVNFLKEQHCNIYIMPYKSTPYIRKFKRWVNGYFYKYETFHDYLLGVRT